MIMRIFQVEIRPGKEAAFKRFFHDTAIPLMQKAEGLVQILPGAARPETPRQFSFVMIWESLAALKAFAGDDIDQPHIDPEEEALVASRTIRHYDLVALP
jgi:heme-degrading monooxygenase HmoA